jgi:5-formyltetrahydrofolate cyclo-ligase
MSGYTISATQDPPAMIDKPALRKEMRQRRRQLDPLQQRRASSALANRLSRQAFFQRATHIAAYLANDGEIDPLPLLYSAQRQGKHLYLPILVGKALTFVRFRPGVTPLRINRLGILEPVAQSSERIDPSGLDLVLLPLVAFDGRGGRLGMGGGFYDRTFARPNSRRRRSLPLLIGLAHACQQTTTLPIDPWDIPVDGIATDLALTIHHRRIGRT